MRARITLLAGDAKLAAAGPWRYEPWKEFKLPQELTGGGGTSFQPVFEYVAREMQPLDLLVYFTEAEGDFPESMPVFPVIWLVKGRRQVPWGQQIQLN